MKKFTLFLFFLSSTVTLANEKKICQNLDLPNDPKTGACFQPDPHKELVIVFAAHPDDETIGFSGQIAQAVRKNKQVIVEMMTDGEGSGAQGVLKSEGYGLTDSEFGQARLREFQAAMIRLNVSGIHWNRIQSTHLKPEDIENRIQFWKQHRSRHKALNAELFGVASDKNDFSFNIDHSAVFNGLLASQVKNKKWFLVYEYRDPSRGLNHFRSMLNKEDCARSRLAKNEYRVFAPLQKRYAIGWTYSTPGLFQNAYQDCAEFIVGEDQLIR